MPNLLNYQSVPRKKRTPVHTLAIVLTVFVGLWGASGCLCAGVSPMLFDKPGTENNALLHVIFYLIVSFPVTCLVCCLIAGNLIKREKFKAACAAHGVALLHFAITAVLFACLK